MPPRFAYWTILIDNKPTAFRAREQEELLPTLQQLRRTNKDVVLKWFARGRLWETPEAAQAASRAAAPVREKRGHDWRPGGAHKDPRDRFKKGKRRDHPIPDKGPEGREIPRSARPRGSQPWRNNPPTATPRGSQPWRDNSPTATPRGSQPWRDNSHSATPRGSQPRRNNPPTATPRGSQPWRDKPAGQPPRGGSPWRDRPNGAPPGAPARPRAPRPADAAEERGEADSKTRRESPSQPPSSSEPRAVKPNSPNRR
jgi:hypothetical protein